MPRYNPEWRAEMERTLPPSDAVREQLKDYLARTGLQDAEFAHRIGYSRAAIYAFRQGTYATNVERP